MKIVFLALVIFFASFAAQAQASAPSQQQKTPAPDQANGPASAAEAAQKIIHQLVAGEFAKVEALYDERMAAANSALLNTRPNMITSRLGLMAARRFSKTCGYFVETAISVRHI